MLPNGLCCDEDFRYLLLIQPKGVRSKPFFLKRVLLLLATLHSASNHFGTTSAGPSDVITFTAAPQFELWRRDIPYGE